MGVRAEIHPEAYIKYIFSQTLLERLGATFNGVVQSIARGADGASTEGRKVTEELEKAVAGRLSEERSERVVALVPAHNEEALIADTVSSLLSQTRPPERVIVVADNCTDRTPQIAEQAGAEVFFTRENRHKKAGGLTVHNRMGSAGMSEVWLRSWSVTSYGK